MSFSIEKIATVYLMCFKCKKDLVRHKITNADEIMIDGGVLYDCPKCRYTIIVGELSNK